MPEGHECDVALLRLGRTRAAAANLLVPPVSHSWSSRAIRPPTPGASDLERRGDHADLGADGVRIWERR